MPATAAMHVLFLEPSFPANQREFVRGMCAVGTRVTGIGEAPATGLDPDLRGWLHGYEQVPSIVHEGALVDAARRVMAREPVDRLEATVESHVLAAAHVREALNIPGTSARTAWLCRDKPAMKEVLRRAGVACARSTGATSPQEVRAFIEDVGYPVILKPRDAAGASGTHRANGDGELEAALRATGVDHGASVAVEEFVEGHEGFYDTLCVAGTPALDFACHYYPNVLEAMRTRWISPQLIATNRVDEESYEEARQLGKRVIEALGIETSATHMEWFFGPKGLRFSEIGCRPPGVRVWDLYAHGNDLDIYAAWAEAIVHGRVGRRPSRAYAAGMIALRPDRDGTIEGYEGVEEIRERFGPWILDAHLPPPGTATRPVEDGYMANAWIRMRHADYDELRGMLDVVGETVHVRAR